MTDEVMLKIERGVMIEQICDETNSPNIRASSSYLSAYSFQGLQALQYVCMYEIP